MTKKTFYLKWLIFYKIQKEKLFILSGLFFNKPKKSLKDSHLCTFNKLKISQYLSLFVFTIAIKSTYANNSEAKAKNPTKASQTLILSQQEVLKQVLGGSLFVQKIQAEREKNLSQLLDTKYSFFSWQGFSNWTQSQKRSAKITAIDKQNEDIENLSLGLEKSFPYIGQFKSFYSDTRNTNSYFTQNNPAQAALLDDFVPPNTLYSRHLNLKWSANSSELLGQHWTLKSIKEGEKSNQWLYLEKAEQLALQSVTQYWKAYMAWISYQQTQQSLNTYKQLVRQIKQKTQYNFLNPGERPQVLAEYENLKQLLDKNKQFYEDEKKALLVFLNKEDIKVEFKKPTLQALPNFTPINIEETRAIKIKQAQLAEQNFKLKIQKTKLFPGLSLSAKGALTPVASSLKDLSFHKDQSFYELGLGLHWVLFSKSFYQKVRQAKYQLKESEIDFSILKQELKNQISTLEEQTAINFTNIKRADKANSYQKKLLKRFLNLLNKVAGMCLIL